MRRDVTVGARGEGRKVGVRLSLMLRVLLLRGHSAAPLRAAWVTIRQADARGVGPSREAEGAERPAGLTGIQVTDGEGRVAFDSILPGWQPGCAPQIAVSITTFRGTADRAHTTQWETPIFIPDAAVHIASRTSPYMRRPGQTTTLKNDPLYRQPTHDDADARPIGEHLTVEMAGDVTGFRGGLTLFVGFDKAPG